MQQTNNVVHATFTADFTSIEERVLANMFRSDDKGRVFMDGELIYSPDFTLEGLYEKITGKRPERPFNDDERRALKSINFGLIYGMSKEAVLEKLGPMRYKRA